MIEWLLTSSSSAAFLCLILLGLIPSVVMTLLLMKLCQGRVLISLLCFCALFKVLSSVLFKFVGAVETWDNPTAFRMYLFGFSFLLGAAIAFVISAFWSHYDLYSPGPDRDRVPIRHNHNKPKDNAVDVQEDGDFDDEDRHPRKVWTLED